MCSCTASAARLHLTSTAEVQPLETMQASVEAFSLPFTDAGKVQCVLLSQPLPALLLP